VAIVDNSQKIVAAFFQKPASLGPVGQKLNFSLGFQHSGDHYGPVT
jgi:hypothetical protein